MMRKNTSRVVKRRGGLLFLLLPALLALSAGCRQKTIRTEELLVVLNKSEDTATILDRNTGLKLGVVVTGVAPHEVTAHSERALAVAANFGTRENPGSSLTVVDLVSKRARRTISLERFRRPHGIQFFRDGQRVIVTVEGSRAILVVNVDTERIEKLVRTDQESPHMVVLSQDETNAYVSNIRDGTVSVLDLEQSRVTVTVSVGRSAEGLDLSPDGRELWVANRRDDTVSILDTESLEVVATLPCKEFPLRVRFTPDGRYVLVSNARSGDVAVFSTAERREVHRISMELTERETQDRALQLDLNPVPIGIVASPDSSRAYVANTNVDLISVVDLKTWAVLDRYRGGGEPDGMALARIEFEE